MKQIPGPMLALALGISAVAVSERAIVHFKVPSIEQMSLRGIQAHFKGKSLEQRIPLYEPDPDEQKARGISSQLSPEDALAQIAIARIEDYWRENNIQQNPEDLARAAEVYGGLAKVKGPLPLRTLLDSYSKAALDYAARHGIALPMDRLEAARANACKLDIGLLSRQLRTGIVLNSWVLDNIPDVLDYGVEEKRQVIIDSLTRRTKDLKDTAEACNDKELYSTMKRLEERLQTLSMPPHTMPVSRPY